MDPFYHSRSPFPFGRVLQTELNLKEKAKFDRLLQRLGSGFSSPCNARTRSKTENQEAARPKNPLEELKRLQTKLQVQQTSRDDSPSSVTMTDRKTTASIVTKGNHRFNHTTVPMFGSQSEAVDRRKTIHAVTEWNNGSFLGDSREQQRSRRETEPRSQYRGQNRCQNCHCLSYNDFSVPNSTNWRSRSLSNIDSVKWMLQLTKKSLEDLYRICSPVSANSNNKRRLRTEYSPETVCLETTGSNSVVTDISNEEYKSDNAYSTEDKKLIDRPKLSIDYEDWIAKFKNMIDDMRKIIRNPPNLAELRKAETEKLILEAKLRLEARLYQRQNIEDEVKARLRLEGLIIPEPKKDADFVDLTKEQSRMIERALEAFDQQVLVEKFNISIRRKDIETLCDSNWLNDEVINFFFNLIMERSGKNDLPSVYVFNTFFYTKLCQGGHASLKRWTRKVDIFSYDMVLIPVHLGVHWCLAVIDFRKKAIFYYDSLGGSNLECIMSLKEYLKDESLDKKNVASDFSDWQEIIREDIPHQTNGSDCGVFTCKFADFVSRDKRITFTQHNMSYFRRRMFYEILFGKLLI